MCHSVVLVLPSEVGDEVVWDGKDEDLLFALCYFMYLLGSVFLSYA